MFLLVLKLVVMLVFPGNLFYKLSLAIYQSLHSFVSSGKDPADEALVRKKDCRER